MGRERPTPESPTEPAHALRKELIELVLARGYTRSDKPFTLSSGGTSHDYVDLRRAVAGGSDLRLVATAVLSELSGLAVDFDAIGGMTMGADPVAHAVALIGDTSWFSVRKGEKAHGARRRLEGFPVGPGSRVVVFEDTVSTSRSLVEACDVVAAAGATIVLACTLLDRGDVAAPLLAERSIRYHALLDYRDLGIVPIEPSEPSEPGGKGDAGAMTGSGRPS